MNKKNVLIAATSGILLGLSFPPYPFPFLAFVGLLPLLFLLHTNDELTHRYKYIYLTFFLYHGLTNWWISSWQSETDPYLMASGIAIWLAHPFFFHIPFVFYYFIKKKFGKDTALWTFPFGWTAFEWLHSLGEASYPWLSLGYTQIFNQYWIQFVDITGVWGSTFLIVLANVILLKMVLNLREKNASFKSILKIEPKLSAALLAIILIPNIYGLIRVQSFQHSDLLDEKSSLKVAIIQPNINPWQKWESKGIDQVLLHQAIYDSLAASIGPLDLCIWSETAIPSVSISVNQGHFYPFLDEWIERNNVSLMTGFSEYYIYPDNSTAPPTARKWILDSSQLWEPFNAALMLNPYPDNQLNPQVYRKSRLTPFAERLPYADKISFAQSWFQWGVGISSWGIGREQYTLKVENKGKTAEIGSVICIESIYPDFVAGFVREGAQILSIITNDAWYDYTIGPEQHYQIAAMRAIETRRYIARCANTGVSGIISPSGKSILRANQYEQVGIAASIPLLSENSLYVQFGDVFAILVFAVALLFVLFGFFGKYFVRK